MFIQAVLSYNNPGLFQQLLTERFNLQTGLQKLRDTTSSRHAATLSTVLCLLNAGDIVSGTLGKVSEVHLIAFYTSQNSKGLS